MKSVVYFNYGPPEVVSIVDSNKPILKPDEILIQVHATAVNRTDCSFRGAEYFINRVFAGLIGPRKANRQKYYDHLQLVRETGDWESWINFFLSSLTEKI